MLSRLLRLCSLTLLLFASAAFADDRMWVVSEPVTIHFGIETDRLGSQRIDNMHVDLAFPYNGGAGDFFIALSESVSGLADEDALAPEEGHLYGSPATGFTFSQAVIDAGFGFLGGIPGERFWILPEFYQPGMIFLGVQAEGREAGLVSWNPGRPDLLAGIADTWLEIRPRAIRGPAGGHFTLYQQLTQGPVVYMASFKPESADPSEPAFDDSDVLYFPGGHSHYAWGFSKPGLYEIDFQVGTYVIPAAPEIGSFEPATAGPGETVTLLGRWFTPAETVRIGSLELAEFTVHSDGRISFTVSAGAASAPLTVASPHGEATTVGILKVTTTAPADPLAAWRLEWFETTENTGDAADETDPDRDGLPNLAEFFFGGNPLLPATAPLPEVLPPDTAGRIGFAHARRLDRGPVAATLEGSANLSSWQTLVEDVDYTIEATSPLAEGFEWRTLRLTEAAAGIRFLRLRIERLAQD
ncbi:MAG: hypothetical protein EA425_01765 [Puniceicoccaceae bacterium]|nr:MAG: hypothetical protein EA425_01765 [Puniceicoccaceae bacterium]